MATTTQQTKIPPWQRQNLRWGSNQGENLFERYGFQPFKGDRFAPMSDYSRQSMQQTAQLARQGQPYATDTYKWGAGLVQDNGMSRDMNPALGVLGQFSKASGITTAPQFGAMASGAQAQFGGLAGQAGTQNDWTNQRLSNAGTTAGILGDQAGTMADYNEAKASYDQQKASYDKAVSTMGQPSITQTAQGPALATPAAPATGINTMPTAGLTSFGSVPSPLVDQAVARMSTPSLPAAPTPPAAPRAPSLDPVPSVPSRPATPSIPAVAPPVAAPLPTTALPAPQTPAISASPAPSLPSLANPNFPGAGFAPTPGQTNFDFGIPADYASWGSMNYSPNMASPTAPAQAFGGGSLFGGFGSPAPAASPALDQPAAPSTGSGFSLGGLGWSGGGLTVGGYASPVDAIAGQFDHRASVDAPFDVGTPGVNSSFGSPFDSLGIASPMDAHMGSLAEAQAAADTMGWGGFGAPAEAGGFPGGDPFGGGGFDPGGGFSDPGMGGGDYGDPSDDGDGGGFGW